jgi:hypothetical protein
MQLVTDPTAFEANSRLAAIRLCMLISRCMENARRDVGDSDSALILVAVVAISGERLTRTELPEDLRSLATPLPPGVAGDCNISSIAAATGLNRETTRRKVRALVDQGFLQRSDAGEISFAPGVLRRDSTQELVKQQLEAIARFANEAIRDGVLTAG